MKLKKQFNKDFENICDWFVDNKLSMHFGEDKSKLILFVSKQRLKNVHQLNTKYNHTNIKQQVTHLGCVLDKRMSCEPMALKVVNKTNGKLKFIYRKKYVSEESKVPVQALSFVIDKLFLKPISTICDQMFIFSPNDSPSKTMKSVF